MAGDPASLSQAGGSLRSFSHRLAAEAERSRLQAADLAEAWSGRASLPARREAVALAAAAAEVATASDRLGAALQEHATDLAEAAAEARRLAERAAEDGLDIEDGRVVVAWGIVGEADPARAAGQHARATVIQGQLDVLLVQLGRRRARLAALADEVTAVLAGQASRLRG